MQDNRHQEAFQGSPLCSSQEVFLEFAREIAAGGQVRSALRRQPSAEIPGGLNSYGAQASTEGEEGRPWQRSP